MQCPKASTHIDDEVVGNGVVGVLSEHGVREAEDGVCDGLPNVGRSSGGLELHLVLLGGEDQVTLVELNAHWVAKACEGEK